MDPPVVFDGVVCASRQHLGYLRPLVAYQLMLFNDDALLQCTKGVGGVIVGIVCTAHCAGVGPTAGETDPQGSMLIHKTATHV